MPRDKSLGSRNVPKPPRRTVRGKFKDLTKATQQQRITEAEEAGRLSAEKAAAARRHWNLAPGQSEAQARAWAAKNLALAPGDPRQRPRAVPRPQEIDTERLQHRDIVERAAGKTKRRFIAPPPPPSRKPKDSRVGLAAEANWALRAPVDLPGRGARRQLVRTMSEQEIGDIVRGRKPAEITPEEARAFRAAARFGRPGIAQKAPGVVADFLFSEEQQQELLDFLGESGETAEIGGRAIGGALGTAAAAPFRGGAKLTGASMQAAGLDPRGIPDVMQDIAEITHNFVRNVSEGAVGIGPMAVQATLNPEEITQALVGFYAENFVDPAKRGEWGEVAANLKRNPDVLLDLMGGVGVAMGTGRRLGAAGRALQAAEEIGLDKVGMTAREIRTQGARTGKVPQKVPDRLDAEGNVTREGPVVWGKPTPRRWHQVQERDPETGKMVRRNTPVQRYVSPDAAGEMYGNLWDRFLMATAAPAGRLGGASRRILEHRRKKSIRETAEVDRARMFGPIERFREMATETRFGVGRREMNEGEKTAFDRMLVRGGTPEEQIADIQREIAGREAQGLNESVTQRDELVALQRAAEYLQNPSERFLRTVEEGRVIANRTQATLVEAGLLRPETAERLLNQPMQWLEGLQIRPVVSPMRDQIEATLIETWGADNPVVELTMQYMDMQATSFGRRNGVDPEVYYREVYHSSAAVDSEDFMSALNDANDDVWLTQTDRSDVLDGPEFAISEKRAGPHLKAHRDLTGQNGEEARLAAEAKAQPKGRMPGGITTIQQKLDRILRHIPAARERAEFARWYSDIPAEFERYFGDRAAEAMRAWLASQVATSPSGGMLGLLKAMEYKYLNGRWPEKGFNVNIVAMGKAWDDMLGTDPAGVAAKISDFFNSAYGYGTRTWLQHAPGYGPGVVDRWTLRSDGFVDHQSYSYLQTLDRVDPPDPKVDPDYYDMSAGPRADQYEWASIRLNELRDRFNEQRIDGRSNWAVEEVQALDWFATRREWGEPGGGWDDTWGRNTYDIIGEVVGEQVRDWLNEGERGAVVTSVAHNGAHGRVEILGTESQADALARKLANESGRTSYTFYTAGKEGSQARAGRAKGARKLGIDILPSERADAEMIFDALRHKARELENQGLLVLPYGNGGVRIMFADPKGRPIKKAGRAERDALVDELTKLKIDARPIAARMGVFHGSGRTRSLYRGLDPRGVFARAAAARRRGSDFRVGEVAGRDGAERFVAGLQRNARSWSLSPRSVEDFTERGYRAFLSDDGMAGAALSPDGEIVSVFNSGSDKGLAAQAIIEAINNGGTWLNCYDGFLNPMYANVGFREAARISFDDVMAPSNWTYENGRPDIVFMAFAPDKPIRRGRNVDSHPDPWTAASNRARKAGERGHNERSIADMLTELANRGDSMTHDTGAGILAQWKRKIRVSEGDPVALGAVRLSDDGAHLVLNRNAANFSTLLHENAHATLVLNLEWMRQGGDPRLPDVLDALGLDSIEQARDPVASRRAQELWARTVEAAVYLSGDNHLITAPHLRRMVTGAPTEMKKNYRRGIAQIAGDEFPNGEIEALLKNDDVMSLIHDLHNAVYGVERRGDAVFMPRIAPTSKDKVARVIRRVSTSPNVYSVTRPKTTSPVATGRRLGIREERGEYERGPGVVAGYATAAMRREVREGLAADIKRSPEAKPIKRDQHGFFSIEPGHVIFDYSKVPGAGRRLDERLGLKESHEALWEEIEADREIEDIPADVDVEVSAGLDPDMEPQEVFEQTARATNEIFENEDVIIDPDKVDIDNLPEEKRDALSRAIDNEMVVQVPRRLIEEYQEAVGGSTVLSKLSGWLLAPVVGLGLDALGAMQRWNMILKPGYAFANVAGSATTATMYNPFWLGQLKKASDRLSGWPVDGIHAVDDMAGMGSFEMTRLLDEADEVGKWRQREKAMYGWTSGKLTAPERRVRRMVTMKVLREAGFGEYDDFMALVEAARRDPDAKATYNQLARWAEDANIRFRGMSPFEKAIVRRGIFVYSWVRASLRYTARFPIDNPVQAALMNRLGNEGWDNIQESLEKEIGFRGGLPLGEKISKAGERMVTMADVSSLLPFGAGATTMRTLSDVVSNVFGTDPFRDQSVRDMLSDGVLFALAIVEGEGKYGRSPTAELEGYTQGKGFSSIPLVSWAYRFADPSSTETTTFGPRDRWGVLGQFALGQLYPRDTKVDAAHEAWLKRQPKGIAVPMRAQAKQDKVLDRYVGAIEIEGGDMPEEYVRAAQARAMYDTLDGMAGRLKGSDAENAQQRAIWKGQVLAKFYPGAHEALFKDLEGTTTEEGVDLINRDYSTYVSDPISDMRRYAKKVLGEKAMEGVE